MMTCWAVEKFDENDSLPSLHDVETSAFFLYHINIYLTTKIIHRQEFSWYNDEPITPLKIQFIEHIYVRKIGMAAHILRTFINVDCMSHSTF